MGEAFGLLLIVAFFGGALAAWLTHLGWLIWLCTSGRITAGLFIFGVGALFIPPGAVLHGIAIWLGARVHKWESAQPHP